VLAGVSPIGISRAAMTRSSSAPLRTPSIARLGFDQRIGERLAAFARDLTSEMLALAFDQYCELAQDLDTPRRLRPRLSVCEEPVRGLDLRSSATASSLSSFAIGARSNA
jgi:hypothetical protein